MASACATRGAWSAWAGSSVMAAASSWSWTSRSTRRASAAAWASASWLRSTHGCARTRRHPRTWRCSPTAMRSTCTRSTDSSKPARFRWAWPTWCSRGLARVAPGLHAAVAVRHHAVERAWVVVEDQRQEFAVAFPHRQLVEAVDVDPFQRSFRIALQRRAEIGRAPVLTPVTNAHRVCRLLLAKKKLHETQHQYR